MAYTYQSLEERDAGRKALAEQRGRSEAEFFAKKMLEAEESKINQRDNYFARIGKAKEDGIKVGAAAAGPDVINMLAAQGVSIPVSVANSFNQFNAAMQKEDDIAYNKEVDGLGMNPDVPDFALDEHAEKISDKLLIAAMEGTPDEEINAAIEALNVSPKIKLASAKKFVAKRDKIAPRQATQGNLRQEPIKAQPTQTTLAAYNIVDDTARRTEELMARLNGQQGAPRQV